MTAPTVSAADVEWIDKYGHAQVCGYQLSKEDTLRREQRDDRRSDGRLTVAAKERIATDLTSELRIREAHVLAVRTINREKPASFRQCEG